MLIVGIKIIMVAIVLRIGVGLRIMKAETREAFFHEAECGSAKLKVKNKGKIMKFPIFDYRFSCLIIPSIIFFIIFEV